MCAISKDSGLTWLAVGNNSDCSNNKNSSDYTIRTETVDNHDVVVYNNITTSTIYPSKQNTATSSATITADNINCETVGISNGISSSNSNNIHLYPLLAKTNTGTIIGCDFIISATGVTPNIVSNNNNNNNNSNDTHHGNNITTNNNCSASKISVTDHDTVSGINDMQYIMEYDDEGYIVVDSNMRTSVRNVFAAGDCCSYQPNRNFLSRHSNCSDQATTTNNNDNSNYISSQNHFFQMRLWTQVFYIHIKMSIYILKSL